MYNIKSCINYLNFMKKQKIFSIWLAIIVIVSLFQPYFQFWFKSKPILNFSDQSFFAKAACSNECAYIGQTSGGRVCGDYDSDSCLEWSDISSPEPEPEPQPHCTDECAYIGQRCSNGGVCGDYDSDPCLECSQPPSCTDECAYIGQKRCSGASAYQVCGNYDSDSCLEWSSPQNCPSDRCIATTWRHYYCSCGQCKYSDVSCSSKCFSCGDGTCNSDCGETSANCPQDCKPSCQNECSYQGQTEKRCSGNYVQKRTCGNYDSDPCLEWSSWQNEQNCGSSGWTDQYRCSSHYLQRKYIERGCSNNQCFANSEWRQVQDCGTDSWTNNYRCQGNWVQREKILRGCSNNQCYQNTQWINYQNCEEEGKVCQNGQCVLGCQNECSSPGQKRCADNSSYQVCGNYDNDPCLEWSSSQSCGQDTCLGSTFRNYFCTGWGICTYQDTQCSSNCFSCGDGTCNSECGETSANCPQDCGYPELEVSCYAQPNPAQTNQQVNFVAQVSGGTGNYNYSWSGACESNQSTCSTSFANPGTYCATITVTSGNQEDSATCSVQVNKPQCECGSWSNWQNQGCGQGGCASNQMHQIRTRDCNPDGCDVEQQSRCVEDSSCQPQNDPVSGTLSVSSNSVCIGQQITLTISGQDDNGLSGFYAYYQGNWHWQSASGTSDTKSWNITENTPGVYSYCGQVFGYKPDGTTETANTSPYCINVTYNSCAPSCTNECSYTGQIRCYDYNHRQVCGNYDSDSCLEWSSPEICSGPTTCGYGICASNQRPNWYCSQGNCTYSCVYDTSCEQPSNYLACYNNDVWWFSGQTHQPLSQYRDCGNDYCESWGDKYCVGNKVYQRRTCYDKGCANAACYSTSYTDTRLVEECDADETCSNGECVKECECSSGPCCDGCHYKSTAAICDVEVKTQYGCPWGLGCGADVGKRTKSRFRYCSGNSSQCTGRWSDWGNWTNWLVADYCSSNEVCRVGQIKCQYNSACVTPSPSPYYIHYSKICYNNDLYWIDSNGVRQEKYRDCEDKNECTVDSCENGKCLNELYCDGSTCLVGSEDYCKSCDHCGDGICNCDETTCSCPQDCKIQGLTISLLAKKGENTTQWREEITELDENESIDFLLIVSNKGEEKLDNVSVQVILPEEIVYEDALDVQGQYYTGDINSGLNIGDLNPGDIRTISFKGRTARKIERAKVDVLATVSGDNLSASDNIVLRFKESLFARAAVGGTIIGTLAGYWYIWLLLGLILLLLLFVGGFYLLYYLIKRRQEKERQQALL